MPLINLDMAEGLWAFHLYIYNKESLLALLICLVTIVEGFIVASFIAAAGATAWIDGVIRIGWSFRSFRSIWIVRSFRIFRIIRSIRRIRIA